MSDAPPVTLSFSTFGANLDAIDSNIDRIAREFFGSAEWVTISLQATRQHIRGADDATMNFAAEVIVAAL